MIAGRAAAACAAALRATACLCAAAALSACTTPTTLTISLVTPQDDDTLAAAKTVRVTLSEPPEQVTAPVGANESVNLSLSAPASGTETTVTVEAFDGSGARVARGRSPIVVLQPLDLQLRIYMGRPGAVGVSPASPLPSPRDRMAAAAVPGFGAMLVGGIDETGAPLADTFLYDEYFHTLDAAAPSALARGQAAVATLAEGPVLVFGGAGGGGVPLADLSEIDPAVAPLGAWSSAPLDATAARAGAALAELAPDEFLVVGGANAAGPLATTAVVTGFPMLTYAPGTASLAQPRGAGVLAVAAFGPDGPGVLVTGGGPTSPVAEWYDEPAGRFTPIVVPAPVAAGSGAAATVLPSGLILVAGGVAGGVPIDGGWAYSPRTGEVLPHPGLLAFARAGLTLTALSGDVLAAGGVGANGSPRADAEVLDAQSLAQVAVVPLSTPRAGGTATVLETGEVLLAGGDSGPGVEVEALELYSPR